MQFLVGARDADVKSIAMSWSCATCRIFDIFAEQEVREDFVLDLGREG